MRNYVSKKRLNERNEPESRARQKPSLPKINIPDPEDEENEAQPIKEDVSN